MKEGEGQMVIQAMTKRQRGLVQLRNELVSWLRGKAGLPEPISHSSACSKCGYLGVCDSVFLGLEPLSLVPG